MTTSSTRSSCRTSRRRKHATKAAQAAQARRDANTEAAQQARRERAPYAKNFIDTVRAKTLAELQRPALTEHAIAHTLWSPGERCDKWELEALHDYLEDLVPEGENVANHLTELKQTKGKRGAPTVSFEFHVLSHRLAGVAGWMVYPALTTEFKQVLGLHNLGVVPAPAEEE